MLDPADDLFFANLTDFGAAAVDLAEKDAHWSESGQCLLEGFTGSEVQQARREGRAPSLSNVRRTQAGERKWVCRETN
jgi:hypothetical protein